MIINSPSGWTYRDEQENGDQVNCQQCGGYLDDDYPIYTNKDGYAFCSEFCILDDHDADEDLHPFVSRTDKWPDLCVECGDTEEGLMHNNTERNIEPLLWEY